MAQPIITSRHIVKPSSPTPLASKIHKLSFIDQIAPPIYIPLIFFYENDDMQHEEISRRLKQSLSEILTIFYPLAGTLNSQNSFVDCNDRGAEFVEARVHARLQEFIENPKMEELQQLVPADSLSHDDNVILSVKTSFFDCGGFSVGVCLSHKVVDGASAAAFTNAWAATCRSEEASRIIHPSLDLALHFPPRDLPPSASGFSAGITREKKIGTKRIVFEKEKVEKLRKEASIGEIKNPSRVEAVSAFLWRCFIEANKRATETTTSFAATHAVNLRPRAVPPIPDHTFGNCFTSVSAIISWEEYEGGNVGMLVSKLRTTIRAVDDHYINNVINEGINSLTNETGDMFRSGNCFITSWWRFPVYEVDFGWGKPVWVSTATMPYMNAVILMDNPSRDGVEAWINVPDQQFFEIFQHNYNKLRA